MCIQTLRVVLGKRDWQRCRRECLSSGEIEDVRRGGERGNWATWDEWRLVEPKSESA